MPLLLGHDVPQAGQLLGDHGRRGARVGTVQRHGSHLSYRHTEVQYIKLKHRVLGLKVRSHSPEVGLPVDAAEHDKAIDTLRLVAALPVLRPVLLVFNFRGTSCCLGVQVMSPSSPGEDCHPPSCLTTASPSNS